MEIINGVRFADANEAEARWFATRINERLAVGNFSIARRTSQQKSSSAIISSGLPRASPRSEFARRRAVRG